MGRVCPGEAVVEERALGRGIDGLERPRATKLLGTGQPFTRCSWVSLLIQEDSLCLFCFLLSIIALKKKMTNVHHRPYGQVDLDVKRRR